MIRRMAWFSRSNLNEPKPGFKSDPFVGGDPNDPNAPWFVRHRMRALLVTALIPLAVGLIAFTGVWLWVQSGLKAHPTYAEALRLIRASSEVRAELGDPVEPGFLTTGKVDGDAGTVEMMFSLVGASGEAGVRVFGRDATPDDPNSDAWVVTFLDVGIKTREGREKVVTLVDDEQPQRFADDAQAR